MSQILEFLFPRNEGFLRYNQNTAIKIRKFAMSTQYTNPQAVLHFPHCLIPILSGRFSPWCRALLALTLGSPQLLSSMALRLFFFLFYLNNDNSFLTVAEAGKSKIRVPVNGTSAEGHFPVRKWPSFCHALPWERAEGLGPFDGYKAVIGRLSLSLGFSDGSHS